MGNRGCLQNSVLRRPLIRLRHLLPARGEKGNHDAFPASAPRPASRGEGGRRPGEGPIPNSQFLVLNSQFSILNSQSSILNSQFSILNSVAEPATAPLHPHLRSELNDLIRREVE